LPDDSMNIFDRDLVRRRRERAAAAFESHDFLLREIAERLADRLLDVRRDFPFALDLGCHTGEMGRALAGRGGVRTLVQSEPALGLLRRAGGLRVVADEEMQPFAAGGFDLVTSCLALHWVNDLPGALIQVRRALAPDGLFLAAMLGGETLVELRDVLLQAEMEVTGGASPRVSPYAEVRDMGGLLQRAGFALPVVDSDRIDVTYANALALMRDLRGMGEANATHARPRTFTRRGVLLRAAALYEERFGLPDGRIPVTFQVLYLTGWAPDATRQQQPLRPGSAAARLADALDATERPAGEKTRRP